MPGFGGGISQQTNDTTDKRTGVAAILAYKPSRELSSQLDLFYSKQDIATKKNIVKAGLGGPITNAVVSNGVASKGTFALAGNGGGLINYVENVFDNDEIKSLGWKTTMKVADGWVGIVDLNHNSAQRVERDLEYYGGITSADTLNFDVNGGNPKFSLGNPSAYTSAATMAIRDQTGWSGIDGVPQAGYAKGPTITDKVDALRFDVKHELPDGMMFSDLYFGANFTKRTKDRTTDEGLIVSATGNGHDRVPFPSGSSIYKNVGDTGLDMLTFNPTATLAAGTVLLRKYNDDILSKTWGVEEKVTTAYAKAQIETNWLGVPVRGNVGLQIVGTDQSSAGYRAGVGSGVVLSNPANKGLTTAGTTYTDVLPSLNLTGDLSDGKLLRFAASEQIARATLTDMRNSFAGSVDTNPANTGTFGKFVGSAGNPYLKPFKAKSLDLSFEKYFGKRGYLSAALFYKKLDTYITTATNTNYDFSSLAQELGLTVPAGGAKGVYTTTVNGGGGNLKGVELTASMPFDFVHPWLSGFGANGSYANTSSSVNLPDLTGLNPNQQVPSTGGLNMPLPGLSKTNTKLTLYYEKAGFSAFVAKNHRSTYVGSVANDAVGGYPTLRYIEGSSWVEGNNLNSPTYRQLRADGTELSSSKTGRTIMFKLSYKM